MPITKSAKKALRQNVRRKTQNLKRKTAFKGLQKQVKKLVEQNKAQEAQALLPQLAKALDKAAQNGTIKKKTAARKKSRVAKLLRVKSAQ